MANPIAVLVEDDPDQMVISRTVLTEEGFEVRAFESLAPVLEYLQRPQELVDLFVLDRRLPVRHGDNASDELGDELLAQVSADFPDACIIVFTGFASIEHVQSSVEGSAPLPSCGGETLDRISVLQKNQSLKFKSRVRQLRQLVQALDDVEILAEDGHVDTALHRRMLRRLAYHYGAASVTAQSLGGGLTEAAVWRCELRGPSGPITSLVAKQGKPGKTPEVWLTELLPKQFVATGIATISGLMAGMPLQIFQVAGDHAAPVMDLLGSNPALAAEATQLLRAALSEVPSQSTVQRIDEICSPLIQWDTLVEVLSGYDVPLPAGSLTASVDVGARHGDLHPGNILLVEDDAVLIDFDSCTNASGALDPVVALLATLTHPDSPIRGVAWPGPDTIESTFGTDDFGAGHSCEPWFRETTRWMLERSASRRELWTLVLAYSARQLQYGDVLESPEVVSRVVALAQWAGTRLCSD